MTPINSGSDPKWTGEQKYEVLVAMLVYTPTTRILFEDQLVAELKKEGINAVPSYSVYPNVNTLNSETFTKFLSADPTLAVFFAQAKNVSKQQSNQQAEGDSLFSNLLRGGEWDTTFTARIESALYVHGQTDAVWWDRVRLEAEEQKVLDVVQKYAGNIIVAMKQSGTISRLK